MKLQNNIDQPIPFTVTNTSNNINDDIMAETLVLENIELLLRNDDMEDFDDDSTISSASSFSCGNNYYDNDFGSFEDIQEEKILPLKEGQPQRRRGYNLARIEARIRAVSTSSSWMMEYTGERLDDNDSVKLARRRGNVTPSNRRQAMKK